jgi:hypothetical protein
MLYLWCCARCKKRWIHNHHMHMYSEGGDHCCHFCMHVAPDSPLVADPRLLQRVARGPTCSDVRGLLQVGNRLAGTIKVACWQKVAPGALFRIPCAPHCIQRFRPQPKDPPAAGNAKKCHGWGEKVLVKPWSNGFDDLKHPPQTFYTHEPCTNPGLWGTPDAWACVGAEWMMCPETWEQSYKHWSPPSDMYSLPRVYTPCHMQQQDMPCSDAPHTCCLPVTGSIARKGHTH